MDNTLFDLKIKELELLDKNFKLFNDTILVVFDNNIPNVIGCRECYLQDPIPTQSGFKIGIGELINYYEKFNEMITVPAEIAINCWLCPICYRLFKELIPNIDYLGVNNVSIQND
jgi:hypothetical protein